MKQISYTVNFNNIEKRIVYEPNVRGNHLNISWVLLPLFHNVCSGLKTDTIKYSIGGGSLTLPAGFYSLGADLIVQLNTISGVDLLWTFDVLTKSVTVSSVGLANFSMTDCRLLNLMLGFEVGVIDGSTNSYTSTQIINLYPYSCYVIDCDQFTAREYYASNRQASLVIPINTFNFMASTAYTFDKQGYDHGVVKLTEQYAFPMDITISILFLDDSLELMPLTPNQYCSIKFILS